jgi:tetratricopeptide (TPR) repeat protein
MRNDEASAFNNLGLSYFENEQFDEALNAYSTAIQKETTAVDEKNVNPEHLSFYLKNRGLAYYHLGEMD